MAPSHAASASATITNAPRPRRRFGSANVARTLDAIAPIEVALLELTAAGVAVGARMVNAADEAALFDVERAAVRDAVPSRRHQFATGRVLLRQLLGRTVPIPIAPDRRPVLPATVVASLAHDDDVAVAVVGSARRLAGVGIDIEPTGTAGDLADAIVRSDDALSDPTMAFVVKEAAYKAWSRPGRPILDHHDVRTSLAVDGNIVAAVVPTGDRIIVRAVEVAGRWLALAVDRLDT